MLSYIMHTFTLYFNSVFGGGDLKLLTLAKITSSINYMLHQQNTVICVCVDLFVVTGRHISTQTKCIACTNTTTMFHNQPLHKNRKSHMIQLLRIIRQHSTHIEILYSVFIT